jgi:hypothetical protein
MTVKGKTGTLKVGYQQAARLGTWTLAPKAGSPAVDTVVAQMVDVDEYWIEQEPLDLVLVVGPTQWIWRGIAATRDGASLIIDLTEKPLIERQTPLVVR